MFRRRRVSGCGDVLGLVEFEQVPLSGGLDQAFASRAKDVSAENFDLPVQLIDGLFVFLDGLIVHLGSLIERGLEILDLLSKPIQQVVTFARISRP
jgi:hypothetical protein